MSRLSLNTNTTANDLVVNTGSAANSKNGDALRTAFTKINSSIARAEANFIELYATAGADVDIPTQTNNSGKYLTTNGSTLSWATVSSGTDTGVVRFNNNVVYTAQSQNLVINPSNDSNNKIVIPGAGNGGNFPLSLTNTEGNVSLNANTAQWIFGTDNTTKFPYDVLKTRQDATFYIDAHHSGENASAVVIRNLNDVEETITSQISVGVPNVGITAGESYNWSFGADGTTQFPDDTINAGTNEIYIQSSNSVALAYTALDGDWESQPNQNQIAGLAASPYGVSITLGRTNDGEDGPTWSHEWLFDKDGVLNVPGAIEGPGGQGGNTVIRAAESNSAILTNNNGFSAVSVQDSNILLQTTVDNEGVTSNLWTFGNDGTVGFPSNAIKTSSALSIKTPSGTIVTGLANWDGGGGWNQGFYGNLATTGGTGTGLTVDVAAGGGGYINIGAISINNPGTGYTNGDVITIDNENNLPGTFTVVVTTSVNTWEFDVDGKLTLSEEGVIKGPNGVTITTPHPTNPLATRDWTFSPTGRLTVPGVITTPDDDTLTLVASGSNEYTASVAIDGEFGRTLLRTYDGTTLNTWEFDVDGNLNLPVGGNILDSGGNSVLGAALSLQAIPSTKYGTPGDTKGMVAIDSATGDFYYCTTNYTDGVASIWRKVTGSDAW